MDTSSMNAVAEPLYELRFESLFQPGRALVFPCNVRGEVPLDQLSERSRSSYFFARATMGREYSWPVVLACCVD